MREHNRKYNNHYGDNNFSHIIEHIMHFLHASIVSFHRNLVIVNLLCEFLNAKSLCGLDGDYCDNHHFPNNVISVHLGDRAINGNLFTLN